MRMVPGSQEGVTGYILVRLPDTETTVNSSFAPPIIIGHFPLNTPTESDLWKQQP